MRFLNQRLYFQITFHNKGMKVPVLQSWQQHVLVDFVHLLGKKDTLVCFLNMNKTKHLWLVLKCLFWLLCWQRTTQLGDKVRSRFCEYCCSGARKQFPVEEKPLRSREWSKYVVAQIGQKSRGWGHGQPLETGRLQNSYSETVKWSLDTAKTALRKSFESKGKYIVL